MSAVQLLLLPLFLHAAWVAGLYVALTVARIRAVRAGEARTDDFARADGDPRVAARFARNLTNQYEAPLFAWVATLLLLSAGAVNGWDAAAGWVFLLGRLLHTGVQTLTDDVTLRGRVFMVNFVAICWLLGHAAWETIARGALS